MVWVYMYAKKIIEARLTSTSKTHRRIHLAFLNNIRWKSVIFEMHVFNLLPVINLICFDRY